MKKNFKIPDHDYSQKMIESHYYNWLKEQNVLDIHFIKTKVEYLKSIGFIQGESILSEKDLFALKAIESFFFFNEIKPNIINP